MSESEGRLQTKKPLELWTQAEIEAELRRRQEKSVAVELAKRTNGGITGMAARADERLSAFLAEFGPVSFDGVAALGDSEIAEISTAYDAAIRGIDWVNTTLSRRSRDLRQWIEDSKAERAKVA